MINQQIESEMMMKPLRRQDVTVHELDDEALVYDATTADTHRLNNTAYFIWKQCDGKNDAGQIAQRIVDIYNISFQSACEHVRQLLNELQCKRLTLQQK